VVQASGGRSRVSASVERTGAIDDIEISVVIPVYGCAACLVPLHERLSATLTSIGKPFEILFVDDCARDGSWPGIEGIAARDPHVRGILLSRNFGQQLAITAGLSEARGRWIVVMDCDLQEPPEEIPRLYEQALAGNEIVYARRRAKAHSAFRATVSRSYNYVLRKLTNLEIDRDYGALSMISHDVRDSFLRFRERDRHYLHVLKWLGYQTGEIVYQHRERHAGRSSYSLARLITLAFGGLFFQTTNLLRWIIYGGFIIAAIGVVYAGVLVYFRIYVGGVPGWTTLTVLVLVLSGMLMTSIGVCGLYLGRIFEQVKDRPLFVVRKKVGPVDSNTERS
jgi:polyisoprenyl-phosphate glycosyltransferase